MFKDSNDIHTIGYLSTPDLFAARTQLMVHYMRKVLLKMACAVTSLFASASHAGDSYITIKGDRLTYTCRATICFKKDALQTDYDSAKKDETYWCGLANKGGKNTCLYYKEKSQLIMQCSAECGNARCTKNNLTIDECLVANFR